MVKEGDEIPVVRIRGHEAFTEFMLVDDDGEQIDATKDFEGTVPGFDLQDHDRVISMLLLKVKGAKDKKVTKQINQQI